MSMCQLVVLFIALLDTLICRLIISSCRMAIGTLAYWHIESLFLFLFFSIYSAEEFFNFHFTLQFHNKMLQGEAGIPECIYLPGEFCLLRSVHDRIF